MCLGVELPSAFAQLSLELAVVGEAGAPVSVLVPALPQAASVSAATTPKAVKVARANLG